MKIEYENHVGSVNEKKVYCLTYSGDALDEGIAFDGKTPHYFATGNSEDFLVISNEPLTDEEITALEDYVMEGGYNEATISEKDSSAI